MSRSPLVAANWKMHGDLTRAGALTRDIVREVAGLGGVSACICPTFVHLHAVRAALADSGLGLGAQDVCEQREEGAFTGEVSAAMLADAGCSHVIVGHSERRHVYGESDRRVAEKFDAARLAGLAPILCVGETLEEREADRTNEVLSRQLDAVTGLCGVQALAEAVIAYEPVWAIGTGRSATPEQAQEVHAFLRAKVAREDDILAADLKVLYGGSVKPDNAQALFSQRDVDGGLIGGASLDAGKFAAICRAAADTA